MRATAPDVATTTELYRGSMIEETIAELTGIASAADDADGYFPALYARVTADVADGIENDRFEDGARIERLADTFAGYYLRAHRSPSTAPRCWQAAWNVTRDPDLLIVQHLLLGINAHVNHDLPQAVIDVAPAVGGLEAVRRDFDTINDVLASSFTTVIRDLDRVARWSSEAAMLGGGRLFNFSLRVARAQAWAAAERLDPLDVEGRRLYVQELDRLVTVLAYLVTQPVFPATVLVRIARRLENRDPRCVTRALLGLDGP